MSNQYYQAVVIGVSAGGLSALEQIITALPADFCLPVMIVQHISKDYPNYLVNHFTEKSKLPVTEGKDKEEIKDGTIYFAPPDYHLLLEPDKTFTLSVDDKVNFCRPAIDVLFKSAAEVYFDRLIGVILTGANSDGANGLLAIKQMGGLTIVQSPETAEVDVMPKAAIASTDVDHIIAVNRIGHFLATLG